MRREQLLEKAESYAWRRGLDILGLLGDGTQGMVWRVRGKGKVQQWALKIHERALEYRIEVKVYERLRGIHQLEGFNVPALILHDAEWKAIEMGMVERPFVLDFAQACLDFPPDFSSEVWEDTHHLWSRRYGDDWPRVQRLLDALEGLGIYYLDVHGRNVAV